ncbi:hypothetical protein OE750_16060 [Lentibacter sp. XHP0401]|nr:hypothetical protein [Lentibacter sp. XHP0401]MCV2894622.1 hypothetical protein [Lentibacter sp. XHP0401]
MRKTLATLTLGLSLLTAGSCAVAEPSHGSFTAKRPDPHRQNVQVALESIRSAASAEDVPALLAWFDPDATFSFGTETECLGTLLRGQDTVDLHENFAQVPLNVPETSGHAFFVFPQQKLGQTGSTRNG